MNRSQSRSARQRPRDAEGRFESKGQARQGKSRGRPNNSNQPRDSEGRFEKK